MQITLRSVFVYHKPSQSLFQYHQLPIQVPVDGVYANTYANFTFYSDLNYLLHSFLMNCYIFGNFSIATWQLSIWICWCFYGDTTQRDTWKRFKYFPLVKIRDIHWNLAGIMPSIIFQGSLTNFFQCSLRDTDCFSPQKNTKRRSAKKSLGRGLNPWNKNKSTHIQSISNLPWANIAQ